MYMYTVYVAFFVLSIESTHYLLLATFVVLVPFQARILRAQATIVKISSYIRLFFEKERTDMHWESMQEFLSEHPCFAQTKENIIDKLSGTGATQLGCLSAGFFIFKDVCPERTLSFTREYRWVEGHLHIGWFCGRE